MKKESFDLKVTDENSKDFAVIPHSQLEAIGHLISAIETQVDVLKKLSDNSGITPYSFERKTKTLADVRMTTKEAE